MLVLEEAVEAGSRKEPMESSKKLLLLPLPLTLALLVGCLLVDKGLLKILDCPEPTRKPRTFCWFLSERSEAKKPKLLFCICKMSVVSIQNWL